MMINIESEVKKMSLDNIYNELCKCRKSGIKVIIDDPEGEYKELTKMLSGTIVEFNQDNKTEPDEVENN